MSAEPRRRPFAWLAALGRHLRWRWHSRGLKDKDPFIYE
jgi:hypothetical protein